MHIACICNTTIPLVFSRDSNLIDNEFAWSCATPNSILSCKKSGASTSPFPSVWKKVLKWTTRAWWAAWVWFNCSKQTGGNLKGSISRSHSVHQIWNMKAISARRVVIATTSAKTKSVVFLSDLYAHVLPIYARLGIQQSALSRSITKLANQKSSGSSYQPT